MKYPVVGHASVPGESLVRASAIVGSNVLAQGRNTLEIARRLLEHDSTPVSTVERPFGFSETDVGFALEYLDVLKQLENNGILLADASRSFAERSHSVIEFQNHCQLAQMCHAVASQNAAQGCFNDLVLKPMSLLGGEGTWDVSPAIALLEAFLTHRDALKGLFPSDVKLYLTSRTT